MVKLNTLIEEISPGLKEFIDKHEYEQQFPAAMQESGLYKLWDRSSTQTTESFNRHNVGGRVLFILASMIWLTHKYRDRFIQHKTAAAECVTLAPKRIMDDLDEIRCIVDSLTYECNGIPPIVTITLIGADNQRREYIVNLAEKTCSCGHWQSRTFPCLHPVVYCLRNGIPLTSLLHPMLLTVNWKAMYVATPPYVLPLIELELKKSDLKLPISQVRAPGKPKGVLNRRLGAMDYQRLAMERRPNYVPRRCCVCMMIGHRANSSHCLGLGGRRILEVPSDVRGGRGRGGRGRGRVVRGRGGRGRARQIRAERLV